MKNYYDQQMELATTLFRIATLNEEKAYYQSKAEYSSPEFKERVSSSIKKDDPFSKYADKIIKIDDELETLYKEAEILEKYLEKMEKSLRSMKGTLERIFVDRYIDGLEVRKLAIKYNYSESNIYELLRKIRDIIKNNESL